MRAIHVLGAVGLLALCACNGPSPDQSAGAADYSPPPPTPEQTEQALKAAEESASAEAAKPARFGKRQISAYTINMTMAQLREFLGSPAEVGSPGPGDRISWFYWDLPVYDEDAGTQAKVVRFTFEGGRVVEVGF